MPTLAEKRKWRQAALLALYELTDGSTSGSATQQEIAARSGVPEDQIIPTVEYLESELQAKITTFGGMEAHVDITRYGIRDAEREMDDGAALPSVVAVFTDVELRQHLEPVLASIESAVDNALLDDDDEVDIRADVQSATDQLRAARPNRGVVKAALSRAYSVLQVAAVTGGVLEGIDTVLRRLGV
jgi:hypothetical protein